MSRRSQCANHWIYPAHCLFYASSLNTQSSLFLYLPCTKRRPHLGVVLSIWRKWLSSSSSDMPLNSTSCPSGSPNSSLRQQTVLSEMLRILATSAHRNPPSQCKVSNCSQASVNRGLPTSPFLVTVTCNGNQLLKRINIPLIFFCNSLKARS